MTKSETPPQTSIPIPIVWLMYGFLAAVGVPWYWRWMPEFAMKVVVGVPLWVAVSLGASIVVSIVTAALFFIQPWADEENE